jgi:DNA helicase INO80
MAALDRLLVELKAGGHRVLLYNQMTRMIDLVEEYLQYRGHSYIRLDGSSKIADRRDLVADWQSRPDIFVFLLSTRAGGLGINLTAADTVIFYDSDWNPTVDQQAMDRAHRLGQTRKVTVYRLITSGSIEERMRVRARQKGEIHRVVIAGGQFRHDGSEAPPASAEKDGTTEPEADGNDGGAAMDSAFADAETRPTQRDMLDLLMGDGDL